MNRLFGASNQKPQPQPTQPVKQVPVTQQQPTVDLSEQSKRVKRNKLENFSLMALKLIIIFAIDI